VVKSVLQSSYAALISRLVLGGVFLVAGITKALDPGGLAASVRSYELALPEWFVTLSAFGLPSTVPGDTDRPLPDRRPLYESLRLGHERDEAVFMLALFQGALRGLEIDCGCFGGAAAEQSPSLWSAFARDLGLLALGLHIALTPAGRFSVDALLRRRSGGESYEV
jgi:uncharacterized membrane protein YphA (DoxX/SURF4 family)